MRLTAVRLACGGADILLPAASETQYERRWQEKRHTDRIRWDACISSMQVSEVCFVG
jgi:hypothetical protein